MLSHCHQLLPSQWPRVPAQGLRPSSRAAACAGGTRCWKLGWKMKSVEQGLPTTAAIPSWLSRPAKGMGGTALCPPKRLPSTRMLPNTSSSITLPSGFGSQDLSLLPGTRRAVGRLRPSPPWHQQRGDLSSCRGRRVSDSCSEPAWGERFNSWAMNSTVSKQVLMTLTSKIRGGPAKPCVGRAAQGTRASTAVPGACKPSPVPGGNKTKPPRHPGSFSNLTNPTEGRSFKTVLSAKISPGTQPSSESGFYCSSGTKLQEIKTQFVGVPFTR